MSNSGRRRLVAAREVLQGAIEDEVFCRTVAGALSEGGKALLPGNGGSTADAQDIAGGRPN